MRWLGSAKPLNIVGWTAALTGLCVCNIMAMRDVGTYPILASAGASAPNPVVAKEKNNASGEDIVAGDIALERPVFSPNRLPYQPPVVPPTPVPMVPQQAVAPPIVAAPPQIKLQGIRDFGGVTSALVGSGDKVPEWVRVGDTVEGWQINEIDKNRLRLASNDRHVDYYLYEEPPK
ncbi:hypothetical protein [Rhizobium sp. SG741]|uniref:hypothetical protein n=1 Tax=Rhizobium sp. SG741 TaxID=2587114 RepID=UPI001447AEA0|nr:hypothetical protein [Rhizobium sp. SG741]NKJ09000.1 hypothetical protein [Rhizobium sp. SG741]